MELYNEIEIDLLEAIKKNYDNESYSGAIKDAIILLSDVIRDKTGLEGDGGSLIGQAFGGNNPKIKLNNLQTDSEKDIQKGMQDLLRGLYSAIRNPRNHDKIDDTKDDAEAIILFINYLLKMITKSKLSFEKEAFLKRVFDKHYVISEAYSDLIVMEIPNRQKADIAINVLLKRKTGDIYSLSSFMHSLFKLMSEDEIDRIYKVISEELKITSNQSDIRTILKICPGLYWDKIDKLVKIRIENILMNDLQKAEYNKEKGECGEYGALATWLSTDHMIKFEKPNDITYITINKLKSGNLAEIQYTENYLWSSICSINRENICFWLENYLRTALKNKDRKIIKKLELQLSYDEDHPWWKVFENELKAYPEIKYEELPF